jgi:hypothetical protein
MVPAFRHALFSWEYNPDEHGEAERCLSRQLQKLFAQLQLSSRAAVTTGLLTRSFGWTSADSFVQQDVTECFTVVMSFLESQSIGTYIAGAHRGELRDYLCCSSCGDQRGRNEVYQDIHLEVKGHATVEAMLEAHRAEEVLEGVECSACQGKHDHLKGIYLTALPEVLTLHLKRFTLDYATWQRVKLNDEVTIPRVLNMGPYLGHAREESKPELNYALASILVHVGGAHSGHYYCFVCDPASKTWLKFNDAIVTSVSEDVLDSILSLNSTGYGLVYRRVSSDSMAFVDPSIIPADIRLEIEKENTSFEEAKAEWEEKQKWTHVLVYGPWEASRGGSALSTLAATKSLSVHKERATLDSLLSQAVEALREKDPGIVVALAAGRLRLRVFDKAKNLALMPLSSGAGEVPDICFHHPLLLEVRSEGVEFEAFAADGISLQLIQVARSTAGELGTELVFHDPVQLSIAASATVGQLREAASERLGVALAIIQLVLFREDSPMALQDESQPLRDLQVTTGDSLHVDDVRGSESSGRLLAYFELLAHSATVYFNDPRTAAVPKDNGNPPTSNPLTGMVAMLKEKSRAAEQRKSVRVDGRVPLRVLKDKIGAALHLSVGEFKLKRASGQELKDLDLELSSGYGLTDGACLDVQLGAPLAAGEFRFRFTLSSRDGACTSLGALVVSASTPVADVKQALVKAFGASHGVPPPDRMRLRKATGTSGVVRLLQVLEDGPEETLETNYGEAIADGKLVGVQETSGLEIFTAEMMLLRCRLWRPASQELGPVDEIGVLREASFHDLKAQLAAKLPTKDAAAAAATATDVALVKPFAYLLQDLANLASLKWSQQPRGDAKLSAGPPRLTEGDLVVFKDARDPEAAYGGPASTSRPGEFGTAPPVARSRAEPAFQLFTPAEQATREARRLEENNEQQKEASARLEEIRDRLAKEREESELAKENGEMQ